MSTSSHPTEVARRAVQRALPAPLGPRPAHRAPGVHGLLPRIGDRVIVRSEHLVPAYLNGLIGRVTQVSNLPGDVEYFRVHTSRRWIAAVGLDIIPASPRRKGLYE